MLPWIHILTYDIPIAGNMAAKTESDQIISFARKFNPPRKSAASDGVNSWSDI